MSCGIHFWQCHPALWVAMAITLGLLTYLITPCSLIPFALLLLFLSRKEKIIALLFFTIFFFFAQYRYALPTQEMEGKAIFSISSFTPAKYGGFLYRGTLHSFTRDKIFKTNLPCRVYSEDYQDPEYEYQIEAFVKNCSERSFVTIKSKKTWIKTKKIFNMVKTRALMKKKVSTFLKNHLSKSSVATFLSALVTGNAEDDVQKYVFARLGLAHLFAVSGFHFALFGFAFHFFLRIFLPKKCEAVCLLFLLSFFFFFLGHSASVARAWFMAIFSLIALIVEKEKRCLNTFGLALIFVLLIDPYGIKDLSLQLSFLATAGILMFYSCFNQLLKGLFPNVPIDQILQKGLGNQYLQIISIWFRKALAINLAVHLVLFPVQISVFSKFPWHSLTYNLFFPFLVSVALFFLLLSTGLYFIFPWIGKIFFIFTNWFTDKILWITEYPPFPQRTWYIEETFAGFTTLTLTLIFLGGIFWRYYLEQRNKSPEMSILFI